MGRGGGELYQFHDFKITFGSTLIMYAYVTISIRCLKRLQVSKRPNHNKDRLKTQHMHVSKQIKAPQRGNLYSNKLQ